MERTTPPAGSPEPGPERRETSGPAAQPLPLSPDAQAFEDRFEYLDVIGRGGMSVVHRYRDHVLGRDVAIKFLPHGEGRPAALAEARLAARLQHPGIVTIYETGYHSRRGLWLAMREVSGRTFATVLAHATRAPGQLRSLVGILHKVGEAMAYAHAQGVVHRDLKPENIRIGDFGEVIVLDWGIAGHVGDQPAWAGTEGFTAPEQLAGEPLDPRMDVFAMGRMLERALHGRTHDETAPLEALARQALAGEAQARPDDAGVMADALGRWLDGADARAAARALIDEARDLHARIAPLRAHATHLREAAAKLLDDLPGHAPVEQKAPGWAKEEAADKAQREADALEVHYEGRLDEARRRSDEVPEARRMLGALYRQRIEAADACNDTRRATAYESRLRAIDAEGTHAAFLAGDGRLTLVTDPPGAEVYAARHVMRQRRLVPGEEQLLGRTPLHGVALGRGSWQLRLVKPGFEDVIYPVLMTRGGCWQGVAPGDDAPLPIALPPAGSLAEDECYVPAGWFWSGGDALAVDGLPRRRFWVDAFVMMRDPLCWQRLADDAQALWAAGEVELAARLVPQATSRGSTQAQLKIGAGGISVSPAPGSGWTSRSPVTEIDWFTARFWARQIRRSTGLGWRLPHELEWEKAARGVDARPLPWGHHFDSTWANVVDSTAGVPQIRPPEAFPTDISLYGVRGLMGNVRDWCLNPYLRDGLPADVTRLVVEPDPPTAEYYACRGGAWASKGAYCRAASRTAGPPDCTATQLGVRLLRPWP